MFESADLIHRYTRAEAIADSVLIDVSANAPSRLPCGVRVWWGMRPRPCTIAARVPGKESIP
jgi:hypothetical protein